MTIQEFAMIKDALDELKNSIEKSFDKAQEVISKLDNHE